MMDDQFQNRLKNDVYIADIIKEAVTEAVREANIFMPLSDDEVHWVRMAIKAEAERADLRKAIIEKSLAGLAWMALAGIGTWAVGFVTDHWK